MASSSMIAIPHAAVPGKLDVVLNLTKDDLRIAIQKLSNAAQELARRRWELNSRLASKTLMLLRPCCGGALFTT